MLLSDHLWRPANPDYLHREMHFRRRSQTGCTATDVLVIQPAYRMPQNRTVASLPFRSLAQCCSRQLRQLPLSGLFFHAQTNPTHRVAGACLPRSSHPPHLQSSFSHTLIHALQCCSNPMSLTRPTTHCDMLYICSPPHVNFRGSRYKPSRRPHFLLQTVSRCFYKSPFLPPRTQTRSVKIGTSVENSGLTDSGISKFATEADGTHVLNRTLLIELRP